MTTHHPKECRFCLKPPVSTPLDEMKRHNIEVYFCYTCKAEYLYWNDGELASWSLYITHHDKMYRWTVSVWQSETGLKNTGQLWYVKDPGIPGTRKNSNLQLIKTFTEDFPAITPENFPIKLPTYLIFI